MSFLWFDWPPFVPREPSEDEIVERWITFGGGWTLDEFRPAYIATQTLPWGVVP